MPDHVVSIGDEAKGELERTDGPALAQEENDVPEQLRSLADKANGQESPAESAVTSISAGPSDSSSAACDPIKATQASSSDSCSQGNAAKPSSAPSSEPAAAPAPAPEKQTRWHTVVARKLSIIKNGDFDAPPDLPPTFTKDDLKPKGIDRFVIHPDNRFKSVFEVFIIFCVLYTAVVEPLKVTYVLTILPTVDDFLDLLFAFDIIFQCFCGYHDSGGQRFPVLVFRAVITNYMRTWFLIDLIAAVPFDRFFSDDGGSVLIRVPGLIKTVRLLKLRRIMRKWNALSYGPLLKVVTILGFWLLCAHWVSCIFFIIGWYTCGSYDDTWITMYWPDMRADCLAGRSPDPAVVVTPNRPLYTLPVTYYSLHVRCMYWAMATMSSMGYGRAPTSYTDTEYTYAIAAQIMGACLAAAIFSNIGQMLNKGDQVTTRYQAQLDKVREFGKLYKLPKALRIKLAGYNELLFSVSRGYDTASIASMFPPAVQEEIFIDMHKSAVMRVPMFQCSGCDASFFSTIVRLLRVNVLLDGDFVFRQGEVGDKMYFIKTGYIQIGAPDRTVVFVSKGPGSYMGELTMFNPGMRRNASAWSLSDCILFTLETTDFYSVLRRYDKDNSLYNQMKNISLSQAQKQQVVNKVQSRRSEENVPAEPAKPERTSRFSRAPLQPRESRGGRERADQVAPHGGGGGGTIDHMLTRNNTAERLVTSSGGASPGVSVRTRAGTSGVIEDASGRAAGTSSTRPSRAGGAIGGAISSGLRRMGGGGAQRVEPTR